MRVVDREDLAGVRVEDGDEVTGVSVEIVAGAGAGKDEALLQAATGEALVDGNAPAVNVDVGLLQADSLARLLDLGVGAADLLGPEELLGLERGVNVLLQKLPARDLGLGAGVLALQVGGEVDDGLESLVRLVADNVDLCVSFDLVSAVPEYLHQPGG